MLSGLRSKFGLAVLMLKASWQRGECSLEVAKAEVDSGGYDLIIERSGVVRHIQLKASHQQARAASQKIHIGLSEKLSGCVVWVIFEEQTLALGPFLFFGRMPGETLPNLAAFKVAKHTKADMDGVGFFLTADSLVSLNWNINDPSIDRPLFR